MTAATTTPVTTNNADDTPPGQPLVAAGMPANIKLGIATAAERRGNLTTPSLDALLIGGASLLAFALVWLTVDPRSSINSISWTAFYLAWLVNNPHFMASYWLLYADKRQSLLRKPSFFLAGIAVPAAVIGYFAYGIGSGSPQLLAYGVNAMFFLVGWHYIKQIYGTMIVASARDGYYFSKSESRALKANLFPVWFMSYFNGNIALASHVHYGIGYQTFDLPDWLVPLNYAFLGVSLAWLGWVLLQKWAREGRLPNKTALCSFAAIYVWYLPQTYHPHFFYLIPFFHSLQYMLFVWALKRGQCLDAARDAAKDGEPSAAPARQRLAFFARFAGFWAAITLLAAMAFHWVPQYLNSAAPYDRGLFGKELYSFLFITFINIHHYFIDSVIWRRDNPDLKRYLTSHAA